MTFNRIYAIGDNDTNKFVSEGYKPTKKNEKLITEEIEKLNIENPGRYYFFSGLMPVQPLQTFCSSDY